MEYKVWYTDWKHLNEVLLRHRLLYSIRQAALASGQDVYFLLLLHGKGVYPVGAPVAAEFGSG